MEDQVHQELLSFLAKHNLEESVSNIDEIILSYLVGVVDLVSQGDDGLDIVELMDMMNAYLPGFDQIGRSEVVDWMFGLASKLLHQDTDDSHNALEKGDNMCPSEVCNGVNGEQVPSDNYEVKGSKFPSYDYAKESGDYKPNSICDHLKPESKFESKHCDHTEDKNRNKKQDVRKDGGHNTGPITFIASPSSSSTSPSSAATVPNVSFPLSAPLEMVSRPVRSKRKGRQLSCSSQDSQDDSSKVDDLEHRETQVRSLLEMFPAACTMEARHCLQLSAGDMDRAAQLIIDRQETGQAITGQTKSKVTKKNHTKKVTDYRLDDDSIKSCVLEKYSFVDTEEDKKTYRPPPPKGEAKKLVRYRDGMVVSLKGERYSEVKKKEGEDLKSTYVNLKPARKYRFH